MSSSFSRLSRPVLYRWINVFFVANIFCSLLICLNYIKPLTQSSPASDTIFISWIFFLLSFLTQSALLFGILALLVYMVSIFCSSRVVVGISVTLCVLLLFGLWADSFFFGLYHLHYAGVAWSVVKAHAVSEIILLSPRELFLICSILFVLTVAELFLAGLLGYYLERRSWIRKWSYKCWWSFLMIGVVSYGLTFTAFSASDLGSGAFTKLNFLVLKTERIVPYFTQLYEQLMPRVPTVRTFPAPGGESRIQIKSWNKLLQYPLHPLQCAKKQKQPLNILFIVVDTWRFDALTPTVTPHLWEFSKKTIQFNHHFSGGNCTRAGIFSLFYGLPANYWEAFLNQKKSALLMQVLQQQDYQMGVFSSAPLSFPAFDKTVFLGLKELPRMPTGSAKIRDQAVTRAWLNFVRHRDNTRPFFSFVFYDTVHNYCDSSLDLQRPFQPTIASCDRFALSSQSDPQPYLNRYRNAAYFVDNEIGQILTVLSQENLLKNTVVVVTSDHGEQLNDEHSGYWDHASAYTTYQLQVPMLVYWPTRLPEQRNYLTTHYDVIPTIMKRVLACHNATVDYSVGSDLFAPHNQTYFLAGSYADYAVIFENTGTRIYPNGDFEVNTLNGDPRWQLSTPRLIWDQVFNDLTRYFK